MQTSSSYKECLLRLGYNSNSGDSTNILKKRIADLNLSTSHFSRKAPVQRTEANIFVKDSTADQSTLRRWFKKGEYQPYKCSICNLEPFWNGKELTLILDHINGHNHDDRLGNLRWVCPNCNQQLDTTNARNSNHSNHSLNYCKDCGKVISKNAERCKSCAQKALNSLPVTREELKILIRSTPFTQIGKQFGVTDNAIRKWCDRYNLPRKSSEIKQISEEEWNKI